MHTQHRMSASNFFSPTPPLSVERATTTPLLNVEMEIRLRIIERDIQELKEMLRSGLDRVAVLEYESTTMSTTSASVAAREKKAYLATSMNDSLRTLNKIHAAFVGAKEKHAESQTDVSVNHVSDARLQDKLERVQKRTKAVRGEADEEWEEGETTTASSPTTVSAKRLRLDGKNLQAGVAESTSSASKQEMTSLSQKDEPTWASMCTFNRQRMDLRLQPFVRTLSHLQTANNDEPVELDKVVQSLELVVPGFLRELGASSMAEYVERAKERVNLIELVSGSTGKDLIRLVDVAKPFYPSDDDESDSISDSMQDQSKVLSFRYQSPTWEDEVAVREKIKLQRRSGVIDDAISSALRAEDLHFIVLILDNYGKKVCPSSSARYLTLCDIGTRLRDKDRARMKALGYPSLTPFAKAASEVANVLLTGKHPRRLLWLTDVKYPFRYRADSESYWKRHPLEK